MEPEYPLCVSLTEENTTQNIISELGPKPLDLFGPFGSLSPIAQQSTTSQASSSCHSPQKIENALRYFSELFSQRLHLIGIAQFDHQNRDGQNFVSTKSRNETMPFQYEHGTEIIFRCVNYQGPMTSSGNFLKPEALISDFVTESATTDSPSTLTSTTTMASIERSTWIIKCESGNWIGRSFECGK